MSSVASSAQEVVSHQRPARGEGQEVRGGAGLLPGSADAELPQEGGEGSRIKGPQHMQQSEDGCQRPISLLWGLEGGGRAFSRRHEGPGGDLVTGAVVGRTAPSHPRPPLITHSSGVHVLTALLHTTCFGQQNGSSCGTSTGLNVLTRCLASGAAWLPSGEPATCRHCPQPGPHSASMRHAKPVLKPAAQLTCGQKQ